MFRPPTRPQRFILPRKLQSRYRRHLFTLNLSFKSPARDDLLINFSRLRIHSVQEFQIRRFNLGRICVKQISSLLHDQIPQRSLSPIRLFCPRVLAPNAPERVAAAVAAPEEDIFTQQQRARVMRDVLFFF